jgi:hypothetical protein
VLERDYPKVGFPAASISEAAKADLCDKLEPLRVLDEAFALPDQAEQDYLLAGLGRLVERRGAEPLLAWPLILPQPRFWPEPVANRGQGAATLLRRLLAYAGMGELGVEIEIGASRPRELVDEPGGDEDPLHHAAGWFMGIEAGVCRFGVSDATLADEEMLIGTLGHEAAHAYREYHGLVVVSRDVEEQLTDLTTIYLGFGFFTLQSSFQFKTGHYDASGQRLLYERKMLGYLRPGQLAFLFAVALVVRKRTSELEEVLAGLAPNHAEAVRKAHTELAPERGRLITALSLPPEPEWPEPVELEEYLRPLGSAVVNVADHVAEEREWARGNKVAFRVRSNRRVVGAFVGCLFGFFSYLAGVGVFMWALFFGLGFIGFQLGRRVDASRCSSCERSVKATATVCGFCDTRLVGDIESHADRLEAEERYFAERYAEPEGAPPSEA